MEIDYLQTLQQFSSALAQEGFATHIVEKTQERPYDVLMVFLAKENYPAGGLQLEISFIPQMEEQLAGLSLMQFFAGLTGNLSAAGAVELQQAVIGINRFCPLVGFGILSEPPLLCFRHTLMLSPDLKQSLPLVIQTTWLIDYLTEVFGDALTQIAEGHASMAQAFKDHPFAHLLR